MSGETEASVSPWTVDSLKEYFETVLARDTAHFEVVIDCLKELVEQRFTAQEKAVSAAQQSSQAAIDKAENNAEKWRDSANEWRGAMNDRESDFMRADAYERAHTDLIERVEMMNRTLTDKHDAAFRALHDKIESLAARVAEIAAVT